MSAKVQSTACNGSGHCFCWQCGDTGKREFKPWEISLGRLRNCDRCGGTSRDHDPNPICNGTGLVDEKPAPVLRRRR
jgi:hypothetical protein